jgi:histidinol dehydrogenase
MVQVLELASVSTEQRRRILRRAEKDISDLLPMAQAIIDDVMAVGDAALTKYTQRFDAVGFTSEMIRVSEEQVLAARDLIGTDIVDAIQRAHDNIRAFHERQMPEPLWMMEVQPGMMVGEQVSPVVSAGLYVPRGKGSFPSVMLMLAVPAVVAQVPRIVVITPPGPDGIVDAASLVAASIAGVSEIYAVGGIQAVAGLAYGTETLPAIAKVIGPGSSYVSAAKRLLFGVIDVGTPAGPSESIILTDELVNPELAALDLLVEAEHGSDSAALLVTHSREVARAVEQALSGFIQRIPEWRRAFVNDVLNGYGGILLTASLDESIDFVNEYAPEHLEVLVNEPFLVLPRIRNAGEILLGETTPIPTANYSLGLNAILPTGGFARTYSSVSVRDFLKHSGVGYVSREGYRSLQGDVARLAEYEGFPAHALAITERNRILGI